MHEPSDLPPTSPELVALRAFTEAYWRASKPKQRLLFQKTLSDVLMEMDEAPVALRPASEHAAVRRARTRASAWINRVMGEIVRKG